MSYASVPIEGEDVVPGSSTSGPTSSDLGFIPFHPAVIASSNPTTVSVSDDIVPPTSEVQVETPSPFTAQEDELIAMELEDRLMREETKRRMNASGRSRPGGVRQGRVRLRMSVNPYPHKMALGKWSSQHAIESRKRRSVEQGGRRGQPFILPGERCNPADYGRRGGGPSGAAEGSTLLPAFDATSSSSSGSRLGCDEQESHWRSTGVGESPESSLGLGGSGSDHGGGGGPVLGAAELGCCRASR